MNSGAENKTYKRISVSAEILGFISIPFKDFFKILLTFKGIKLEMIMIMTILILLKGV